MRNLNVNKLFILILFLNFFGCNTRKVTYMDKENFIKLEEGLSENTMMEESKNEEIDEEEKIYEYEDYLKYFISKEKKKDNPEKEEFIRKFCLTDDNPFKIRIDTKNIESLKTGGDIKNIKPQPKVSKLKIILGNDEKLIVSKYNPISPEKLKEIKKLKRTDIHKYNKIFEHFKSEYFKGGIIYDYTWMYVGYRQKELSENNLCFGKMNKYDGRKIIYLSLNLLFLIPITGLGIDLFIWLVNLF